MLMTGLVFSGHSMSSSMHPEIRFVRQLGPVIAGDVSFAGPFGVSLANNGDLLVADDLGHAIFILRPDGSLVRKLDCQGDQPGCFAFTDAVIQGPDDLLYVADTGNNRIQILNPKGAPVDEIKRWNLFLSGLSNPRDLVIDHAGRLLVADWGNHCIRVFSMDGKYLKTIGEKGSKPGQFLNPISVSIGRDDRLYISDFKNHRVQVFHKDHSFSHSFGVKGSSVGEFINPAGLAVDSSGQLFVVDRGNSRVQVFAPEGEFLWAFGTEGNGDIEFSKPTDIALSQQGMAFVVDQGNQRIQVIDLLERKPEELVSVTPERTDMQHDRQSNPKDVDR
jgi:DNA-binding beta-propeller fold protein YncE